MSTSKGPLLHKINNRLFLLCPSAKLSTSPSITANPARMHVLAGWMGASATQLSRYAHHFSQLAPNSHFLLIRSFPGDFLWTTRAAFTRSLQPAVKIIQARCEEVGRKRALGHLHVFSNGGVQSACYLARALRAAGDSSEAALPITSMMLDSAPGSPDFKGNWTAFTVPFARRMFLIRWLANAIALGLVSAWKALVLLRLTRDPVNALRAPLLDAQLFPRTIPREYIFSAADRIVHHQHIRAHAEEAERLMGKDLIRAREYQDSGHVAHAKMHPRQYWQDTAELLDRATVAADGSAGSSEGQKVDKKA